MSSYSLVKNFSKGLVFIFLLAGGLFAILGSGGSDDSPDLPNSLVRFYNGTTCKGKKFTTHFYVEGKKISLLTGERSQCIDLDPLEIRYQVRAVLETEGCGTVTLESGFGASSNCTMNISTKVLDNKPFLHQEIKCPGSCANKLSLDLEMTDFNEKESIIEIPLEDLNDE